MIIYLIFYQNCNFLVTHVDARSWNGDFFTIFLRKQPIRRELADPLLKAKIKIKQIGGFTKSLSEIPNMIVFGLELLIFWSWFRIWTWKYRFPKFLTNLFFSLYPYRTFAYMRWRGSRGDDHDEISSLLASKIYQKINFDEIKNRDINLMNIYLIFFIKIVIFLRHL